MCSTSLRVHCLQRLFEIFGMGDLSVLLPFICLCSHLITSEWTHTYFELRVIISLLLSFPTQIVPALAVANAFSWFMRLSGVPP